MPLLTLVGLPTRIAAARPARRSQASSLRTIRPPAVVAIGTDLPPLTLTARLVVIRDESWLAGAPGDGDEALLLDWS